MSARRGLIVVALAIGCRESHAAHAVSSAQAEVFCVDSIEKRALACSGGAARRVGDTLFVRLDNGREKSYVEDNTSEAPGGYQYEGRIRQPISMHIVESNGHETAPEYIFLNPRTGREVVAADRPVFSPDSTRFATASDSWDNCVELDHPRLEVWRLTDSVPVSEWQLDPWNCKTKSGWGPTAPQWRGPDTLAFIRNDMTIHSILGSNEPSVEYRNRPMLAVRTGTAWRVVTP